MTVIATVALLFLGIILLIVVTVIAVLLLSWLWSWLLLRSLSLQFLRPGTVMGYFGKTPAVQVPQEFNWGYAFAAS